MSRWTSSRRTGAAIGAHLRKQVVGYLALFLVLSGVAGALPDTNTVTSDDIVDGRVKEADVAADAVTSAKIGVDQVHRDDLAADSVDGTKVADGTLLGSDFGGNSLDGSDVADLTGADIQESGLSEVPSATIGGRGGNDYTQYPYGLTCDPGTTTYVVCATMDLTLPTSGRLFVLASGVGTPYYTSGGGRGTCAIYTSKTGGFGAVEVHTAEGSDIGRDDGGEFQISVVTPPLSAGALKVEIHCNQTSSDIEYYNMFISTVLLGPS